ncbi:MAG: cytidylate kinase-like family protein [Bacteroidales bacterium]
MTEKLLIPTNPNNIFDKYFSDVLHDKPTQVSQTGPYISISRDFGSMANVIAQKLSTELNKSNKGRKWNWINKSILIESSKALDLSTSKIEYVFQSQQKSMMDEIVGAMSTRYYKSDRKIRNTIIQVIRSIAQTGNVIIVGRGGVAFANDNPKSFHVKLTAPLEWRVNRISSNYNKSKEEALRYVLETDKERKFLIDSFMGYETDHSIFDIVFNRQSFTDEDIVSTIVNLMKAKQLIE